MTPRTTADFGPLDFSPLMNLVGEGKYRDPAVSFASKEESLYFLDEIERRYGVYFLNRNGYWRKDRPDTIYIPRLYENNPRSMTYTHKMEGGYPVIPFSQLLMSSGGALEFADGELDEILV